MFSREEAQALAYQLNIDHPLFFHQAINVAAPEDHASSSVIVPVNFDSTTRDDSDLTFAAAATEVPQAALA